MRLFSGKVPVIAEEIVQSLLRDEDIVTESPDEVKLDIEAVLKEYLRQERQVLEEAKTRSLVPDDLDSQSAAVLYIGMIQGLVMQSSIFGGKRSLQQQAENIFPILLHGIKTRSRSI